MNGMGDVLMGCSGEFLNQENNYSIIFDDNGRVAYAYLLNSNNEIVSDVWLYNHFTPPEEPEWRNPDRLPFANPLGFVRRIENFSVVKDISEVNVEWHVTLTGNIKSNIFIPGILFAILIEGEKPGKSILASKNGPLAKVLN